MKMIFDKFENSSNLTASMFHLNEPSSNMKILIAVLLGLIDFVTFGGNLLVVIAVVSTKSLHTITNSFLLSLAVADLLVSILVMPISIYSIVTNHEWKLGLVVCDLYISSDIMLCTASILNLCCISLDRYFAITRPLSYCRKRSTNLARKMIALVWIGSILITCPPIFGWNDINRDANSCGLNTLLSYRIFSSMGSFFLPCAVMVFVYLRIFKVIHDREKYLMNNSANCIDFSNSLKKNNDNKNTNKTKLERFTDNLTFHNKIREKLSLSSSQTNTSIYARNLPNRSVNSNKTLAILTTQNETNLANKLKHYDQQSIFIHHPKSKSKSITFNDFSVIRSSPNLNNNDVIFELNSNNYDKELNDKNRKQEVPHSNIGSCKDLESRRLSQTTNKKEPNASTNYTSSSSNKSNASFEKKSFLTLKSFKKSASLASLKNKKQIKNFSLKHSSSSNEHQQGLIKESKAAKTLAVLVGSFIIAWGPFFIMYILEVVFPNLISIDLADLITWIGYLNSTFNPIIYAWYSKQFRDAFYRLTIDKIRIKLAPTNKH